MRYGRVTWRAAVLAMAAGVLASAASWAVEPATGDKSGPGPRARPDARPGAAVALQTGQAAPDVALAPLTFAADANGQLVGTIGKDKLKLSDYKGKAPIVIFSSSYT